MRLRSFFAVCREGKPVEEALFNEVSTQIGSVVVDYLAECAGGVFDALVPLILFSLEVLGIYPVDDCEHFCHWELVCGHFGRKDSHSKDAGLHEVAVNLVDWECLLDLHHLLELGRQLANHCAHKALCSMLQAVAEEAERARDLILLAF